jgi:hypothetical protein
MSLLQEEKLRIEKYSQHGHHVHEWRNGTVGCLISDRGVSGTKNKRRDIKVFENLRDGRVDM